MNKFLLLFVIICLFGCGENKGYLMPPLYEKGIELCSENGGLEYIGEPNFDYRYELTGRFTSKFTGYILHTGRIVCKNNLSSVVSFSTFDARYKDKPR